MSNIPAYERLSRTNPQITSPSILTLANRHCLTCIILYLRQLQI